MNLKKLSSKLGLALVMLVFLASTAFAQTYVSATDGDDGVAGQGTLAAPYKTITKALAETSASGTIIVEPGTYVESITVTKAYTIYAQDFGSNGGTAVILNNVTLNMTTGTDVLSFGETGMPFNIDNLTLTKGVMNIATANVVVSTGSTITRTNGTLNVAPTVTNVNVTYGATAADITAGGELPADIGTGTLTIGIGAANALTVGWAIEVNALTLTSGDVTFADVTSGGAVALGGGDVTFADLESDGTVTVTAGNVTANGTTTLNDVAIINAGTGDVSLNAVNIVFSAALANTIQNTSTGDLTVGGALTYTHDGTAATDLSTDIRNTSTGTITISNAISRPASTGTNTGKYMDVNLDNAGTGSIVVNGGTFEDVDANAGTIDVQANTTLAGTAIASAGTIKVNANTLTFSGAAAVFNGAGKVISATAATVGTGKVDFTKAITVTQAELPNVTVSGTAGKLTLGSNVNVYGDFTLSSPVAGALTDAGFDLGVNGDFTRTDNTLGNVVSTGTLSMDGAGNAVLTAGTQLSLMNVDINKDALATTVDLTASLIVNGNFTITKGTVELNTYHIRMQTGGGTFTNGSGGYNSTGGYLIIEANTTLAGTSVYSNIDVRGTSTATVGAAVKFSGILHITDGVLAVGANSFTFVDDLVTNPDVYIHTDGPGTMTVGAGTVATESATTGLYNLTYTGDASATAGAEWLAAGIKNLSISTGGTTPNARQITGIAANTTIVGNLTVALNQTLELDNGGARNLILAGDAASHSVIGTVQSTLGTGILEVTGDAASITGTTSTSAGANAEVPNLKLSLASTETFSSTNLKQISGDLTVVDGTSTITMNATTATLTGDVLMTDGILTLSMASTTSTHNGDINITDGAVTYTRGSAAAQQVVGGAVTLTDGSLTIGSDVSVTGATSQIAGDLILGANDYTQTGSAASPDYNRTGAGTVTGSGALILDATAAALDLTPGATFEVPNLQLVDGGANGITFNAGMEVTNSLTHTSGAVNYSNLTFSGNTYLYEAGTITGAFTLSGSAVTATFKGNVTIPTLTINSAGTVSIKSNNTTARTITVNTAFTQTKGDLDLDINTLAVSTAFTNTAGNITSSTGYMTLNVAAPTVADGFSVDKLDVLANANFGTKTFTVAEALDLTAGTLTTSADDKLVLGDGATITRTAGLLSNVPDFGATTNLVYDGGGAITAAKEQPATVADYTITGAATNVTLADDVTVTGTLSIAGTLTHSTANTCTMADGSTLELLVVGTTAVAGTDLVKAGSMDLIYGAAVATSTRELGTVTSNAYGTFTGNVTVKGNLTLSADVTINGKLTLNGGNIVFSGAAAGDQLTLLGDFEEKAGEWFTTAAGTVVLSGSSNTNFIVSANHIVTANGDINLNKSSATASVTLQGGNLDFATTPRDLILTKGIFDTDGSSKLILKQDDDGNGQPTQGFTRTSGVIVGNVQKFVDKTNTVAINNVTFPTGSVAGDYRPAVFYFTTAPQSSINLMVNHEEASPAGTNGIPLTVSEDLTVTNYPDFYWYVKSDVALAPSYQYDLEFQAEGYNDYILDGIQNVRMMRRDSGNVANQWRLQGSNANYDNSTIAANWPLVKVINATGGITSQGSRFTYTQSDKAPSFTAALTPTTITEGDTLNFTYVATDPDIGQTVTLSSVTIPDGATFNASTGAFSWVTTYEDSGAHTVTIRATDGTNTTDTTVTVTVVNLNRAPVWTAVPVDTIEVGESDEYSFQLAATDADGDALVYSLVANVPAPDSISVDSTGMLTIIPAFGEVDSVYDVTVRVDDSNTGVVDSTFNVKVVKTNRAPSFTSTVADTSVDEGATLALAFTATDPDADNLKFSVAGATGAMIDSTTGAFTWTPTYTQAGSYNVIVTVTDDGSPNKSAMDTVVVTVNNANAAPTFTKEFVRDTVFVGDTYEFTYVAEDLDGDALTFSFADEYPDDATLTAVDDTSATFSWTPDVSATAIYVIKVKVSDGTAEDNTSGELLVKVVTVDVAGVVTYSDGALPIAGAIVTLAGGASDMVDTTDATGAYMFTGVSSGSYTVSAAKTGNSGGVSAADALAAAKYGNDTTSVTLADIEVMAADVNENGSVNATDALVILRHAVGFAGEDNPGFLADEWYFESNAITVGTANVTSNLAGIVSGDVNSSFTPGLAKETVSLAVSNEDMIKIKPNAEFEVPVRVASAVKVGAYTLEISYDASLMEYVSVAGEGVIANTSEEGVIRLGYADLSGKKAIELEENGVLASLTFKATEAFAKSAETTLTVEKGSEIVNSLVKDANVGLRIGTITVAIPEEFSLYQNYPNPFNPSTTIAYDMPEDGKVTLTVYNTIGQEVAKLVNGVVQEAGSYELKWNASQLATGIYLFRIHVEGAKNHTDVKKMILMK